MKRVDWAEDEIEMQAKEIEKDTEEINQYYWETKQNTADIEVIKLDIQDAEACFVRQEEEERQNRAVIELYCHSHAYVSWMMDECKSVLVDGTRRLPYGLNWSLNQYPTLNPIEEPQQIGEFSGLKDFFSGKYAEEKQYFDSWKEPIE